MQLGQLSERIRRVHVALTWLTSLSWFAVWVGVLSLESTKNLFEISTTYNSGTLPYGADSDVLAVSPIECVAIAVTYNRSMVTYDGSTHQCFLHDINNKTEITDGMGVIYLQDIKTCADLNQESLSGVYRISPVSGKSFEVYCDMESDGGPWTVIQNRQSKEVDFYRNWDQYKHGFGDLLGNFWLGNTHIHTLTETPCVLRVQVESLNGTFGFAEYSTFQVSSEISGYKLSVNGYSGNISDAMRKNNGQKFSTARRDNDGLDNHNCAEQRRGPWWHRMCTHANLNGIYEYCSSNIKQSMFWRNFTAKILWLQ